MPVLQHGFVHLTATTSGGAGIAVARLHRALVGAGHKSVILTLNEESSIYGISQAAPSDISCTIRRVLDKLISRAISRSKYYFQKQSISYINRNDTVEILRNMKATAIVAHYLSSFCSFEDVAALSRATGLPVIWHLLDMGSLTGGCHYAWGCRNYQSSCGNCPALLFGWSGDESRRTLRKKVRALPGIHSAVVAGSGSLANQARASALFSGMPTETILIGVPEQPRGDGARAAARARYALEPSQTMLFFGAQALDDPRKGMDLLVGALKLLATRISAADLPVLVSAGGGDFGQTLSALGYRHLQLPRLPGPT
jgi:hypothetical protein